MCFYYIQNVDTVGASGIRIRFFFDISFFIIITTIGLNIVFGIIVDGFSELRDERVKLKVM